MEIEKQKTAGLLRKYEQDNGHSTQQLRHELISTEKVTIEQRQYYEQQIDQLQREKNELKKELDTLRDVLKELHEQSSTNSVLRRNLTRKKLLLGKQEALGNDRLHTLKLKEDLLTKENELFLTVIEQSVCNTYDNCRYNSFFSLIKIMCLTSFEYPEIVKCEFVMSKIANLDRHVLVSCLIYKR